jgi:predicted HTH domain antitoxin
MIQFQLPTEVEAELRKSIANLDEVAREAFLLQSYRDGLLSLGKVAELRGKGVLETQEWLSERGAPLSYTSEDYEADKQTLARLFPDSAP